ncbi:MAG: GNAT family N-acetyltransferase [Candidatus Altiarchaeota archaeon]
MNVRKARKKDLGQLIQLLNQLTQDESPSVDYGRAYDEITNYPNYHMFVLEDGNELVATVALVIMPGLAHGARHWAMIENVIVDEKHRRKGYGRKLIEHAIEVAKGFNCHKIVLISKFFRKEAHQFYESVGFEKEAYGFGYAKDL